MLGGAVGRRYAQALFEVASEKNNLDAIEEDLKGILSVIEKEKELQRVLYHPQVTAEKKKELINKIFEAKISKEVQNFLNLIIDKHRETYLSEIVAEFTKMANVARNIVDGEVVSAIKLDESYKEELVKVLNRLAGKDVKPKYKVDPSLLGGMVIRIGDKVIDGSVKNKLKTLRQHLVSKIS